MLWVFDINETLLDLSPLDIVFAEEAGGAELRQCCVSAGAGSSHWETHRSR